MNAYDVSGSVVGTMKMKWTNTGHEKPSLTDELDGTCYIQTIITRGRKWGVLAKMCFVS